jgi:kojibiose phosphorylase
VDDAWLVEESGIDGGFDRARANHHETLFTVGNGRLGTRGSLEEGHRGALSGTFLGGVYDGHDVPVIDLVNAPDWLDTAVSVDGVRLDADTCRIVRHHRVLDLRDGILTRTTVFEDAAGRRTRLATVRCASMADRRICALRVEVTPENHASEIVVESGIDGDRRNLERLPLYPPGTVFPPQTRWEKWARARHLRETARSAADPDHGGALYLEMRTLGTGIDLGYLAATTVGPAPAHRSVRQRSERIVERTAHRGEPGVTLRVDKLVAICTSRDVGAAGPVRDRCRAALAAHRGGGFDGVVAASRAVWERLWEDCDCEVVGDVRYTRALRFAVYHLLIAANPDDPTVGIGAKSLSGEGYRGHVFWDVEIFMLPFFVLTRPDTARALLRYRHHTLDGARANSREHGTGGARYAWESADTGREECPRFSPDGAHRIWPREQEVHVSADVAHGVHRYVEATGDTGFLRDVGAEVLFETSRFWVDRVERSGPGYALRQVMGPDEFHSHVDDNAFTNRMVRWHLTRAVDLHDELRERYPDALAAVASRIGLVPGERDRWQEVAAGIVGPRVENGVVEQFTGYFARDEVPITEWDEHGMPRFPAGYHRFNCETTTLLKQPDVVMLMYLLPDEFGPEAKRVNFDHYEARTLHKSSLSPSVHAIMGMEVGDTSRAVRYFERSALVDLADNQGNTGDGMHIASAGGTWQVLVNGFGGLRILGGRVTLRPWLPDGWAGIRFRIRWRGRPIRVEVDHEHVALLLGGPAGGTEEVVVGTEAVVLTAGETVAVALRGAAQESPVAG